MTGNGPRLQPGDQDRANEPEDESASTVGTWASQQAYKLGTEQERARLHDPQAGYGLGHDVCLGTTRAGQPRHPGRMANSAPLVPFDGPGCKTERNMQAGQ